jgi:hypothetical protein
LTYHFAPMLSDRKMRKFIRQWRKRYPYPSDWVDNRANKQCRRSETEWLVRFEGVIDLRRRDVVALLEWKFDNQAHLKEQALRGVTGAVESGHARRCIKRALVARSPIVALDYLLEERQGIRGWGPTMASAVLAACRPDSYAVADSRALCTLKALELYSPSVEDDFTREDWWPYLRVCRDLVTISGLPLREVGRALWAASDHAPKLPKSSKPPKGWPKG